MNAADPSPTGERSESRGKDGTQNIAAAIAEVSERATLLVREEIELAKAELSEKATKLVKGTVVGIAAGVFFLTALVFVLFGCAWLLYYYLPIGNQFTYFWGFFAMAAILVVLGVIAGAIAARAVKRGSPPVPSMAIDEARKIREAVAAAPAASAGYEQAASPGPDTVPVAAASYDESPADAGGAEGDG
ncbi:MAG TPA: phage holin family protein [Solirubrobacteraceae bacterium]|nr:phage holin family protein [Solirubrobacteraceae bacterium]